MKYNKLGCRSVRKYSFLILNIFYLMAYLKWSSFYEGEILSHMITYCLNLGNEIQMRLQIKSGIFEKKLLFLLFI